MSSVSKYFLLLQPNGVSNLKRVTVFNLHIIDGSNSFEHEEDTAMLLMVYSYVLIV